MRPLATLLVVLALAAFPGPAPAAPFAPPVPPAGATPAGAFVVTALPELPAGAYEFELFLVPDAGAPIQVSAELPAGAREVRWRMPAVAARGARLVLRAGGEGREWESAPSARFALAPLPAGEHARLLRGESEAGERLESSAGAAGAGLRAAPRAPALSASATPACVAESSPAPLAAPAESAQARPEARRREPRPAASHRTRSTTPAFTPLRN